MFGNDVVAEFCRLLDVDLIVRAHEAVTDGHAFNGDKNQLCTIFSAPNYCGSKFTGQSLVILFILGVDGNNASVMKVGEKLEISFITLKPRLDPDKLSVETLIELDKMMATANIKSPLPGGGKMQQQGRTGTPPKQTDSTSDPGTTA
jgi:hypothetical protein